MAQTLRDEDLLLLLVVFQYILDLCCERIEP